MDIGDGKKSQAGEVGGGLKLEIELESETFWGGQLVILINHAQDHSLIQQTPLFMDK